MCITYAIHTVRRRKREREEAGADLTTDPSYQPARETTRVQPTNTTVGSGGAPNGLDHPRSFPPGQAGNGAKPGG
ncbi:MAG: hypothetical protein M4579_002993, partial [Chaenotheca gracillima]